MHLTYLTDDLADMALARRVDLMIWGGCDVRVAGFRRAAEPRVAVHSAAVTDLGVGPPGADADGPVPAMRDHECDAAVATAVEAAEIVVARSLYLLLAAIRVRRPGVRLVYERPAYPAWAIGDVVSAQERRRIERSALGHVDLIVVGSASAAGELREAGHAGPIMVLEDKVLALESTGGEWHLPPLPHEASWVIGWFGDLGCHQSWDLLRTLVRQGQGQIEVLVAGLPDRSPAIDGETAQPLPGITVIRGYIPADLPALRASVHFSWMIDHDADVSKAGAALPHDLFENVAHCSIPIVLADSPAGMWFARHSAGVLVKHPETELAVMLSGLDDARYAALVEGIERIPKRDYLILPDEAWAFVDAVTGRG